MNEDEYKKKLEKARPRFFKLNHLTKDCSAFHNCKSTHRNVIFRKHMIELLNWSNTVLQCKKKSDKLGGKTAQPPKWESALSWRAPWQQRSFPSVTAGWLEGSSKHSCSREWFHQGWQLEKVGKKLKRNFTTNRDQRYFGGFWTRFRAKQFHLRPNRGLIFDPQRLIGLSLC